MNNNQTLAISILATFVITIVAGLIIESFKVQFLGKNE